MKNWKTTVAGIGAILVAVGSAAKSYATGQPVDIPTVVSAIMAGVGLILAKDAGTPNDGAKPVS
mgnify:CR=1 FL=1